MDCTGYLNAAISSAATLPAAAVQGAAKLAQNSSQSIVLARAKVFSPVAIAMNPNLAPVGFRLSPIDRMDLLYAIAVEALSATPIVNSETQLVSWRQQDIVWMSNKGTAALQGSGTMSTNLSAGIGVVSLQGSVDAQIRTSREIRYQSFETHILSEKESLAPVSMRFSDLRTELTRSIQNIRPFNRDQNKDGSGQEAIRYSYNDIPMRICELNWQVDENQPNSNGISGIKTVWSDSGSTCSLFIYVGGSIRPSGQIFAQAESRISIKPDEKHTFKLVLQMP